MEVVMASLVRSSFLLLGSLLLPFFAQAQSNDYYCPDRPIEKLVGDVKLPPATAITLDSKLEGLCAMQVLPSGAVVFHAKMDIDADGSPNALTIDPEFGQLTTAFTYHGFTGQEAHVDAEHVPYIVLPKHGDESDEFYDHANIRLGDVAAVFYRGKMQFAFVADIGPSDKIGEGSVALAQALGHNPFVVRNGQKLVDQAIPGGVVYIVFPGSRLRGATPDNILEMLNAEGERLMQELTSDPDAGARMVTGTP